MRSRLLSVTVTVCVATVAAQVSAQTSTIITARARVDNRTALRVSSEMLEFDVADGSGPASVAIDFSAGVRVAAGEEVVLLVEPLQALDGPGGAADVETSVLFHGVGEGTLAGTLGSDPVPVARWTGSGLHQGRVVFRLASGVAGTYVMPVRFVLSAP